MVKELRRKTLEVAASKAVDNFYIFVFLCEALRSLRLCGESPSSKNA
jgi:hypothetical protein